MHQVFHSPKVLVDSIVAKFDFENVNEKIRLKNFSWLLLAMIPLSLLFLLQNILSGSYLIAIVVTVFVLFIISSFFLITRTYHIKTAYYVSNSVFFFTLLSLSLLEAKHGGRILWIYTYPLFCVFIFGPKKGVLWSILLLISVGYGLELLHGLGSVYSVDFWLRLPISYLMVVWITAWLENDRRKYTLELEKEIEKKTELEKRLLEQANTDSLTKLYSRGHYRDIVNEEICRAQRYNIPLSIAVIDLDNFKFVNDSYGHPMGDKVLRYTAKLFMKRLRKADVVGRVGGEEFSITFPHTTLDDAKVIMERLLLELSEHSFSFKQNTFTVTMSVGLCSLNSENNHIDRLYSLADKALYKAKRNGKNRVEWY
jgi:diguanylate cyclase (GGDEF)-like protein